MEGKKLTPELYHKALDEILNTPEKVEMYRQDSLFNACINHIVKGNHDPIDLLLMVCKTSSETRKQLEEVIKSTGFNHLKRT